MYFSHAFKKVMIGVNNGGSMLFNVATNTSGLTAGEIGIFDPNTYTKQTSSDYGKNFIIAQGSFHTKDKMSPFHGGYQESNKTKMINPRYINRFFTAAAVTPQNQIVAIGWNNEPDGVGHQFTCGNTYYLRLDLKGSSALRFMNKNIYKTLDAYTGCCADDCTGGCTGDAVDPTTVYLQWADQIARDPILSQYYAPEVRKVITTFTGTTTSGNATIASVADTTLIAVGQFITGPGVNGVVASKTSSSVTLTSAGAVTASATVDLAAYIKPTTATYTPITDEAVIPTIQASLVLTLAYADTVFGNCTFTVTDHYELEPLFTYASITNETGDPCAIWPVANSSTQEQVTELQAPKQANGVGNTVLREFILSNRYLQEPFHDTNSSMNVLRMRETEDDIALSNVSRTGLYNMIGILHSVPRHNNATNSFSNDQYLIVLWVPTGVATTAFTTFISGHLTAVNSPVVLETF